jgi:hypothetical protein
MLAKLKRLEELGWSLFDAETLRNGDRAERTGVSVRLWDWVRLAPPDFERIPLAGRHGDAGGSPAPAGVSYSIVNDLGRGERPIGEEPDAP